MLLLVTLECPEYCRHCTRRRLVGEEDRAIKKEALEQALAYIRSHEEIRDVLLSGGDPLTFHAAPGGDTLGLAAVRMWNIIRIGTRMPVVCPCA